MKLYTAGGYGEHGRNCFLIEGEKAAILVDCGLMSGTKEPYPHLTQDQIRKVEWLLLTHSHADHTAAYPWLVQWGFTGTVVATTETLRQLSFKINNTLAIDALALPLKWFVLSDVLSVRWGRSGHCVGSVWYQIALENHTLLFTGDYVEETQVYACDPIRETTAELALVDSAHGKSMQTSRQTTDNFLSGVAKHLEQTPTILFPVPKYGRGLELMQLLSQAFPQIPLFADAHLCGELTRLDKMHFWLKDGAYSALKILKTEELEENDLPLGFLFVADPQLKIHSSHHLLDLIGKNNGQIVLSGNADAGSVANELLRCKKAEFLRYPVHQTHLQAQKLVSQNQWKQVLYCHCNTNVPTLSFEIG